MLTNLVKRIFHFAGFKVERRSRLEEAIPSDYNQSPYLPRIYRGVIPKLMYWVDQIDRIKDIEGDVVECGVSIGHGALLFLLLGEFVGVERTYYGFDSFEGFPNPIDKDEATPIIGKGFWASPPDIVYKVLREGRISEELINARVRLVKGWFEDTIPTYEGKIALLHLDGDLYESYRIPLECLYEKVVPGGIIMFDEYNDQRWPGATKAIDEFFVDKPEKITNHMYCEWKYFVVKD